MIKSAPKPKFCPCGIKFTPRGIQKYCSPRCELKHKTGNVTSDNLMGLDTSVLFQMARGAFQAWIKKRDLGKPCISCGVEFKKGDLIQGGHCYKAETHSWLIFDEDNVFDQCDFCNCAMDGNRTGYLINLPKRIGAERAAALQERASAKVYTKYSKTELIEIIEKYKA